MEALWITFGVVLLAELGDKTQLVALGLGARHRVVLVLAGLTLAQGVAMGLSVFVGGALGAALPDRAVSVGGALAFFAFAMWTWWGRDADEDRERSGHAVERGVVASVALAVFVAELGDKTMLVTATLATRQSLLLTWIGATAAVVLAGGIAIVAGNVVGSRMPERAVRGVAAALFAVFGALLLVDALTR